MKFVAFKSIPAEKKLRESTCDECDGIALRSMADEGFFANKGTNFGMQNDAAFAMKKLDVGGQLAPAFADNNGKVHEVRSSADIDRWMSDNQLGFPRMTDWKNPITGVTSKVPLRTVMKANPVTGEPEDVGVPIRETAKVRQLDASDAPVIPENDAFGRPMKNGVRQPLDPSKQATKYVDPATGKRINMGDLWKSSGDGYGPGSSKAQAQLAPRGNR